MTDIKRECEKCGSENVIIMTNLFVRFPAAWEGQLTKKRMSKKEFECWGVNWSGMSIICRDCRHTQLPPQSNPWLKIAELEQEIAQQGGPTK